MAHPTDKLKEIHNDNFDKHMGDRTTLAYANWIATNRIQLADVNYLLNWNGHAIHNAIDTLISFTP